MDNKANISQREYIDFNDLKINLKNTKNNEKSLIKNSNKIFQSIIQEKKILNEKKEKRRQNLAKKRIMDENRIKEMEIKKFENEKLKRKIKAEENIKKLIEHQKNREERIKASQSSKYINNIIPLFKVWENKFQQNSIYKHSKLKSKKKLDINDILKHSENFEKSQIIKQKEREEKIKIEMKKNKSMSKILEKFKKKNGLINRSVDIIERKKKQKDFSLQVTK